MLNVIQEEDMFRILKITLMVALTLSVCVSTVFAERYIDGDDSFSAGGYYNYSDVISFDYYFTSYTSNERYGVWVNYHAGDSLGTDCSGIYYGLMTGYSGHSGLDLPTGTTLHFTPYLADSGENSYNFQPTGLAACPDGECIAVSGTPPGGDPRVVIHRRSFESITTEEDDPDNYYENYDSDQMKWAKRSTSYYYDLMCLNNDGASTTIRGYEIHTISTNYPFINNGTTDYSIGATVQDYECADLLGNSIDEMIVLTSSNIKIFALDVATPTTISINSGEQMDVGYMNDDDLLDLVIYDQYNSGRIRIFFNDNTSSFFNNWPDLTRYLDATTGFSSVDQMEVFDDDNDGNDDICLIGTSSGIKEAKVLRFTGADFYPVNDTTVTGTRDTDAFSPTTGDIVETRIIYHLDGDEIISCLRDTPNRDLDFYYDSTQNVRPDMVRGVGVTIVSSQKNKTVWDHVDNGDIVNYKVTLECQNNFPFSEQLIGYSSYNYLVHTTPVNPYQTGYYYIVYAYDGTSWSVASERVPLPAPSIKAIGEVLPEKFEIGSVYPNPFNPSTSISISVPEDTDVNVKIYDLVGREVADLSRGILSSGQHQFVWNAADKAAGIYFVNVQAPGFKKVQKITLLK